MYPKLERINYLTKPSFQPRALRRDGVLRQMRLARRGLRRHSGTALSATAGRGRHGARARRRLHGERARRRLHGTHGVRDVALGRLALLVLVFVLLLVVVVLGEEGAGDLDTAAGTGNTLLVGWRRRALACSDGGLGLGQDGGVAEGGPRRCHGDDRR